MSTEGNIYLCVLNRDLNIEYRYLYRGNRYLCEGNTIVCANCGQLRSARTQKRKKLKIALCELRAVARHLPGPSMGLGCICLGCVLLLYRLSVRVW